MTTLRVLELAQTELFRRVNDELDRISANPELSLPIAHSRITKYQSELSQIHQLILIEEN